MDHPFRGRTVEFISRCAPDYGELLQDPEIRTLGGQDFLVGIDANVNSFRQGCEIWLPMADVAQISLFDSPEDFQDRIAPPTTSDQAPIHDWAPDLPKIGTHTEPEAYANSFPALP